jgi:hypothetical protein
MELVSALQEGWTGVALVPPSPLRGGIQGGGATRASGLRILPRNLMGAARGAPPPHTGEGVAGVAEAVQ